MSYTVTDTNDIFITRGDSASFAIDMSYDESGEPYELEPSDIVRFSLKRFISDKDLLIQKDIPHVHPFELTLEPSDTKDLDYGEYHYDISLIKSDGYTETFIEDSLFTIMAKV